MLRIAALTSSLRDSPVPAAISLIEDRGVFKFCDDEGHTLYVYALDADGRSRCVDQCARDWPPVAAPQNAHPLGDWTPIQRADGSLQWAYKAKPVYTYSGDSAAGQTNGAGLGGLWHLLSP